MMLESNKPTIGIAGAFQQGKSTLINCLLAGKYAVMGEHLATTVGSVFYEWGECTQYYTYLNDGTEIKFSFDDFCSFSNQNAQVSQRTQRKFKVTLNNPLLKKITLVDTAGFGNNSDDNNATLQSLQNFSFVILVTPERQGVEFTQIVRSLQEHSRPFAVLVNCFTNKDPNSAINLKINKNLVSQIEMYHPWTIGGKKVLSVNILWYYFALCKINKQQDISEDDTFLSIPRSILRLNEDQIIQRSNLRPLMDFLNNQGSSICNVTNYHTLQLHFQEWQNRILTLIGTEN